MARSLTFYNFNDDPTMRNYMALMACIVNPKLTYSRAMNIFEINCEGDKRNSLYGENQCEDKSKNQYVVKGKPCLDIDKVNKFNVLDTKTNMYCEFDNIKKFEKTLGIDKK